MQSKNRIKETTSTTGSGNITLAGAVTNFRTFNTSYGTLVRFPYWIIDDTNNVWEHGIGYLSATTTLVRETIVSNSLGTTVALTLIAGTKDVFTGASSSTGSNRGPEMITATGFTKAVQSSHHCPVIAGAAALTSVRRAYYMPFKLDKPLMIDNIGLHVATLSGTDGVAFAALYESNAVGDPTKRIAHVNDIDVSTSTGSVGLTFGTAFTPILIEPGLYWSSSFGSGIAQWLRQPATSLSSVQIGTSSADGELEVSFRFIDGLPTDHPELSDPADLPTGATFGTEGPVKVYLRGV